MKSMDVRAFMVVMAGVLLSDIVYALVDPRISLSRRMGSDA